MRGGTVLNLMKTPWAHRNGDRRWTAKKMDQIHIEREKKNNRRGKGKALKRRGEGTGDSGRRSKKNSPLCGANHVDPKKSGEKNQKKRVGTQMPFRRVLGGPRRSIMVKKIHVVPSGGGEQRKGGKN